MAIRWKFPLNNDGSDDGFNDSGIAHFSGAKFFSLVREIIQNSLDARKEYPVRVEFDVEEIGSKKFPKSDQLREIFRKCRTDSKNRKDKKAEKFFAGGLEVLKGRKIRMLKASDFNTTGLHERGEKDLFYILTKGRGISDKAAGAGGSYGIGKSAPYVFSDLRTVFYSTMYKKNGRAIHKAQGRSILMSHDSEDGRTQGTGFYGEEEGCRPITDDIPDFLVRKEQGTTVCVAGFPDIREWQNYIRAAVVSSFFAAIDSGKLCVSIGQKLTIDAESLRSEFEALLDIYDKDDKDDNFDDVKLGFQLYDALKRGTERDIQLRHGLGHCKLRVLTGDGEDLPQQVGLIRGTGMLITADYKRLQKFPGIGEFIAVFTCDNEKGNDLLRRMENPQHNAFEPERLGDDASKGDNALIHLADTIRKRIKEIVASTESDSVKIDEMKEFFSTEDGEDGNGKGPDRDFERGVVISKSPTILPKLGKKPPLPPLPVKEKDTDDASTPTPDIKRQPIDISNVRIVAGKGKRERVAYFTPTESGNVSLDFWIIGDEYGEQLQLAEESRVRAQSIDLVKGERAKFKFAAASDVRGALRIVASTEFGKERGK